MILITIFALMGALVVADYARRKPVPLDWSEQKATTARGWGALGMSCGIIRTLIGVPTSPVWLVALALTYVSTYKYASGNRSKEIRSSESLGVNTAEAVVSPTPKQRSVNRKSIVFFSAIILASVVALAAPDSDAARGFLLLVATPGVIWLWILHKRQRRHGKNEQNEGIKREDAKSVALPQSTYPEVPLSTQSGRVLDSNLFKDLLFPDNGEPIEENRRNFTVAVHNASAAAARDAFEQALKKPDGRDKVVLLAGAPGSGKSAALMTPLPADVKLVYVGNFANRDTTRGYIEKILLSGNRAIICLLVADPEVAMDRSIATLANTGRVVPIDYMAQTFAVTQTVLDLYDEYGTAIGVDVRENSIDGGDTVLVQIPQGPPDASGEETVQQAAHRIGDYLSRNVGLIAKAYRKMNGLSAEEVTKMREAWRKRDLAGRKL